MKKTDILLNYLKKTEERLSKNNKTIERLRETVVLKNSKESYSFLHKLTLLLFFFLFGAAYLIYSLFGQTLNPDFPFTELVCFYLITSVPVILCIILLAAEGEDTVSFLKRQANKNIKIYKNNKTRFFLENISKIWTFSFHFIPTTAIALIPIFILNMILTSYSDYEILVFSVICVSLFYHGILIFYLEKKQSSAPLKKDAILTFEQKKRQLNFFEENSLFFKNQFIEKIKENNYNIDSFELINAYSIRYSLHNVESILENIKRDLITDSSSNHYEELLLKNIQKKETN